MKKLLILMPSLAGGGAERVVSHLLQLWEKEDIELHLGLIYPRVSHEYEIPDRVVCHRFDSSKVTFSLHKVYKLIKGIAPNVVFSSMANLNALILFLKPFLPTNIRYVIRENNIVSENIKYDTFKRFRLLAYRYLYKRADVLVCQSQAIQRDILQYVDGLKESEVIPNPCLIKEKPAVNPFSGKGSHVVVVGRLCDEKGSMEALAVYEQWQKENPELELWFLGQGPLFDELKEKVHEKGLEEKVHLLGFIENVWEYIFYADLFFMCSKYEGYPNALLESLVMGTPVLVKKKHPGGTEELLKQFNALSSYVEDPSEFEITNVLSKRSDFQITKIKQYADSISNSYLKVLFPIR